MRVARSGANSAGARLRRADLRGELRRPRGGARARFDGRPTRQSATATRSASGRPRRVRDPDSVVARVGAARILDSRRSASWCCTPPTPRSATTCRGRSRPSTTGPCAGCSPSRHVLVREGGDRRGARGVRCPHRSRRDPRPADRRRARLAPGPRCAAPTSSPPTRCSPAAWRSTRSAPAATSRLDRPPLRPRRLRLELPRRRRAADRRRLVRPPLPRARADRPPGGGPPRGHRPLPGQLDPACAAAGDRGRRVLRRRLGRPLPAADRRGDPHGAVLRPRLRARAARRARRASRPASRPCTRYHAFAAGHALHVRSMLRVQRLVPRVAPRVLAPALRAMGAKRFVKSAFDRYLNIACLSFVAEGARGVAGAPSPPRRLGPSVSLLGRRVSRLLPCRSLTWAGEERSVAGAVGRPQHDLGSSPACG